MNALLLLLTEGTAEESSGLSIILPEAAELFYGAISFAIVFFVLKKFAFPRMTAMLDERRDAIQGKMEEAENELAEAESVKSDYQAKLQDARGEANRIIEDSKETAESLRRDIVQKAEAEARAIIERAQGDIEAERERALSELRAEVGRISVELAEKIVQKEIDRSTHSDLVDEYIQRLQRQN